MGSSHSDRDRSDLLSEGGAADSPRKHDERPEGISALLGRGGDGSLMGNDNVPTRSSRPPGLALLEEGADTFPLVRCAEGGVVESPLQLLVLP